MTCSEEDAYVVVVFLGDDNIEPAVSVEIGQRQRRQVGQSSYPGARRVVERCRALVVCRVAPGGWPPGAPTDPDVPDLGIRLVGMRVRYVPYRCTMRGRGSGNRCSRSSNCCQSTYPALERRESHFRQTCLVSRKKRPRAR